MRVMHNDGAGKARSELPTFDLCSRWCRGRTRHCADAQNVTPSKTVTHFRNQPSHRNRLHPSSRVSSQQPTLPVTDRRETRRSQFHFRRRVRTRCPIRNPSSHVESVTTAGRAGTSGDRPDRDALDRPTFEFTIYTRHNGQRTT